MKLINLTTRSMLVAACALLTVTTAQSALVNFTGTNIASGEQGIMTRDWDINTTSQQLLNFSTTTPLWDASSVGNIYGGLNTVDSGTALGTDGTNGKLFTSGTGTYWAGQAGGPGIIGRVVGGAPSYYTFTEICMWKKEDFTGTPNSVSFDASSALTLGISDWGGYTNYSTIRITSDFRFIVQNGAQFYISESINTTDKGVFTLTNFNNNASTGFQWAMFNPTGSTFDLSAVSGPYGAVNFDNVNAVGFLGLGAGQYARNFEFNQFQLDGGVVPEPSTYALISAGLIGAFVLLRRKIKR